MDNDPHRQHPEFSNMPRYYSDSARGFIGDRNGVSGIQQPPFQGTICCQGSVANESNDHINLGIGLSTLPRGNRLQFNHPFYLSMPLYEPNDPNLGLYLGPGYGPSHLDGDLAEAPDVPDTCFNYISDLLREEDPYDKPRTLHDYLAFSSYYQSLDDAVNQPSQSSSTYCQIPLSICPSSWSLDDNLEMCTSSCGSNSLGTSDSLNEFSFDTAFRPFIPANNILTSKAIYEGKLDWLTGDPLLNRNNNCRVPCLEGMQPVEEKKETRRGEAESSRNDLCVMELRRHRGDEGNASHDDEVRSSKQPMALNTDTYEQITQYEDNLFCPEGKNGPVASNSNVVQEMSVNKGKNLVGSKRKVKKKKGQARQENIVDHYDLLTRCAQAITNMDFAVAEDLLKKLRQHSSPYGSGIERVAHYFANGLESRLAGTWLRPDLATERVSASDILKANRIYVGAVPFKIMSYFVSNQTIAKLAEKATRLHIIDFGISLGLQWPCIIHYLSKRSGGPPRLRITGIDFPQPGFRPAERVEETGRCLATYCERFNVPFEYQAIAENWENIQPEDINIDRDELVVVNCLYRSHHLLDESIDLSSPRDAFMRLVRRMRPDLFVHGIVNAAFGQPVFMTRFMGALSYYSTLFDLFEATMPREHERLLLESKVYGKQVMNVVACEGDQRVERPETYKRWQLLLQRAGFEQVDLDQELMKRARAMVKRNFNELFVLDEDCQWAVQGWKGRILYAISCWRPL